MGRLIAAYPYESYNNIGVLNSHERLPHDVLPDAQGSKKDLVIARSIKHVDIQILGGRGIAKETFMYVRT